MRKIIFSLWHKIIESKAFPVTVIRAFLFIPSFFFRALISLRHFLYDHKILTSRKTNRFVISIGNITAGGAGKTPLVMELASALPQNKLAIVSRGYLSYAEKKNQLIMANQSLPSWEEIGDEPHMIAQNFPHLPICLGKNRIRSLQLLPKDISICLFDDGMQHRKVKKDIEIVTLNSEDPWGKNFFLPRGYLRDHPHRLRYADLIALQPVYDQKKYDDLVRQIRRWSSCPVVGFAPSITGFFTKTKEKKEINKPFFFFSAIANPQRALFLLEKEGYEVCKTFFLPDHSAFSALELEKLYEEAEGKGAMLLCTEKDAVKYGRQKIPFCFFRHRLKPRFGEEHWKKMIEKISLLERQ